MPNWTTHMGSAYFVSRPWINKDIRFFLFGSLLPDLIARIETITVDLLEIDIFKNYEMGTFHTPIMIGTLAALIAIFTNKPQKSFGLIFTGGLFHLFLDILQTKPPLIGIHLFVPFSYQPVQLNFLPSTGYLVFTIWGICLLILLYAAWEKKKNIIQFQHTPHWKKPLFISVLTFLLPFAANPVFYAHNVDGCQFLQNPTAFEGKTINLYSAQVLEENPLIIEDSLKKLTVITDQRLKKGDWISIEGIYQNGKIYANHITKELGATLKSLLSLPAILIFPLIWWDWRQLTGTRTVSTNVYPPPTK